MPQNKELQPEEPNLDFPSPEGESALVAENDPRVLLTLHLCEDLGPKPLEGAEVVFVYFNHGSIGRHSQAEIAQRCREAGRALARYRPEWVGIESAEVNGDEEGDEGQGAELLDELYALASDLVRNGVFSSPKASIPNYDCFAVLAGVRDMIGGANLPEVKPVDMYNTPELRSGVSVYHDQSLDFETKHLGQALLNSKRDALVLHQTAAEWQSRKVDNGHHILGVIEGSNHATTAPVARKMGAVVHEIYLDTPAQSIGRVYELKLQTNHPDVANAEEALHYENAELMGLAVARASFIEAYGDDQEFFRLLESHNKDLLRFMYRISVSYLRLFTGTLDGQPELRDQLQAGFDGWTKKQDMRALARVAEYIRQSDEQKRRSTRTANGLPLPLPN